MKYLLDTNVISEFVVKQPNPKVITWVDGLDSASVYLSVFSIGELRKGIEKLPTSSPKISLTTWLNDYLLLRFAGKILAPDVAAMLYWGELIGRLEKQGRTLPAIDSLIAALATYHNCTLVTRNENDFRDTGIIIINPWKQL